MKKRKYSYKRLAMLMMCTFCIAIVSILKCQASEYKMVKPAQASADLQKTVQTYTYIDKVEIPCEYVNDDTMYIGETVVEQENEPGIRETTVMVTFDEGEEESREILDQQITKMPQPRRVHVGTKKKPLYVLPVTGYIFTSGFGARWGTFHYGVDLAVPTGTDVVAAADGEVIQSGWNGGYGISVYVKHKDGSITRYGHMSETLVCVGQQVTQGEIIGRSGSTGDSTGPHVHFEIRIDDEAVDPCKYFDEDIKM